MMTNTRRPYPMTMMTTRWSTIRWEQPPVRIRWTLNRMMILRRAVRGLALELRSRNAYCLALHSAGLLNVPQRNRRHFRLLLAYGRAACIYRAPARERKDLLAMFKSHRFPGYR
jgi:hypothetical protein